MSEKEDIKMEDQPVLICPHCKEYIVILKINCAIFRHGILKQTCQQIDPHASEELCNYYAENDLIFGCGKPFKIIKKEDTYQIEICDYI